MRERRRLERGLLLLAALVLLVHGFVYGHANPHASPGDVLRGVGFVVSLFFVAHLALTFFDHHGDQYLLPLSCLLFGISCLEIHRLNPLMGRAQVGWLAIAVLGLLLWLAIVRDYRRLQDLKYVMLAGGVFLQLVVMLFGTEVNGARLWLRLGSWSFQPVEIVKILLVVFLAAYLRQHRHFLTLKLWGEERPLAVRYLLPLIAIAMGAEIIFVVQKDLGQGLLFFGVFLTMFYAGTRRRGMVAASLISFALVSYVCYRLFGHVRVRFAAWIDPWQSPHDWGYQIVQALYALASGGWLGSGLYRGQPWRIPDAHTDFIFVSLIEELGSVTAAALLACIALLVVRAFRAARAARDEFGALLACGIGAVLGLQSFLIVGGSIKMIPITGITLPFMSYGGSSLLANFLMLALILQISNVRESDRSLAPGLNRGLRVASIFYLLLLLSPMVYLLVFRLYAGAGIAASPDNPRTREDLRARGGITDRTGELLARSEGPPTWKPGAPGSDPIGASSKGGAPVDGAPWDDPGEGWHRRYAADRALGPLIGYRSLVLGAAGLERSQDEVLRGVVTPGGLLGAAWLAAGGDLRGKDVVLTVDAELQRLAYRSLDGRRGAVVVLDPRNGEVLACVSAPGFDPNRVSDESTWGKLLRDRSAPLLNRATEGSYPPGSVIKPAVLALALDAGTLRLGETFSCPGWIEVNGYRMHDYAPGGHGTLDATHAMTWSCNVAFARIATGVGNRPFMEGLRRMGLGAAPSMELPCGAGNLPQSSAVTPEMLAQMGFGQGEMTVTPLQVAMLMAGLANEGRVMRPHLVRATRTQGGRETRADAEAAIRMCSASSARQVAGMMVSVVDRGTGAAARIPGVAIAGKTGTAENPHGPAHAWFAGFAPADAPRVAIAVIVENAGSGGVEAAPIARVLLEAALSPPGRSK
ncbi:MAG: hypothetical protein FJX76_18025 [Armatimonadetes bacterium]|nr:hypothetical protein [Armatimonadota bacterium]